MFAKNNVQINQPAELDEDRQKVLIVDDLEQNLFSLKKIISSLDVDIITTTSGNEALSLMLHHKIAIAIIDVQMPEMDGFEMAKLMQDLDETKNIPIIFVTAINKERSYVYKGYLAGAVDYLFVPIDPDILLCKLKIFLNIERRQEELEQALNGISRLTNQYQKVLDSVSDGILGLKSNGIISFSNPAAGKLLGCNSSQLIGRHFMSLINPPGEFDTVTKWNLSPLKELFNKEQVFRFLDGRFYRDDGTSFAVEYSCSAMRLDETDDSGHVLVFQDITERKLAEEQLRKLANYDSLTGCSNRNAFQKILKQTMSRAKRKNELFAVLFFDLDNFKAINDMYGHTFGDKLLKSVSERVQEAVREEDHIARYGGDEFAILLGDIQSDQDAFSIANKIYNEFSKAFIISNQEIFIRPSIGISIYPNDGEDPEELVKAADIAMYESKDSDRKKISRYVTSMEEKLTETIKTHNALKNALHNHEFSLNYQLYFNNKNLSPCGTEALLRWNNINFSHIDTESCIKVLEESGLIIEVGEWVLKESCYILKDWENLNLIPDNFKMSVNISMRQLKEKNFISIISNVLEETEIKPNHLQLEITESIVMEDPYEAISICNDLSNMGVNVAIDDFGTGYSSLAYLTQLNVSSLKIDRFFISQIGKDENASKIITATIKLAHNLNQDVIAEGVETKEQLEFLTQYGCNAIQGYYLAKPESADLVKTRLLNNLNS